MSGALPPVEATGGSSAAVPSSPPPPPPQQQQQEITAAQLSDDAIREIIRQQQQQQEIIAAQLSDAVRETTRHGARSESAELRNWLMLVATLTASITYSAALNPPGGVWQADDPAKGYIAGRPVLLDKSRAQYIVFYYCNITSFAMSLAIIVLSSTPSFYDKIQTLLLSQMVTMDIFALAGAFMAGSWTIPKNLIFDVELLALVLLVILFFKCWGRVRT